MDYGLEQLMTIEETMEYLHINSRKKMYKLCHLDSFPAIKIGKSFVVSAEGLKKWIKNNMSNTVNI